MVKRSGRASTTPGAGGWGLLRAILAEQKFGLIAGMVVGLAWSAGKVAVPKLTSLGRCQQSIKALIAEHLNKQGLLVGWFYTPTL